MPSWLSTMAQALSRSLPLPGSRLPARPAGVLLAWLLALSFLPVAAQAAEPVYNAETTYQKLVGDYPFIRIASREPPVSVSVLPNLTYATFGERALQLDLYLPQGRPSVPRPAIMFIHGGGWRSGARENFAPMAIRMAERGYAAATISYRLSSEAGYPAAIYDAKSAVRWMRTHAREYGIDDRRIVIAGGSAGGQIAGLVGVTNGVEKFDPQASRSGIPSTVQAIVNIDGLSDFTSAEARLNEDDPKKNPSAAGAWFGGTYAEKTALWHEASPTFYVTPRTPPILFITSAKPRFSVGRAEMVEKLQAAGVTTQTVMLPDTPHSFWLFDPWLGPTVEATVKFLEAQWSKPAH